MTVFIYMRKPRRKRSALFAIPFSAIPAPGIIKLLTGAIAFNIPLAECSA